MHISNVPEEIQKQYNLHLLQDNQGRVYIKIIKGMYGPKQARIITNKNSKNIFLQIGLQEQQQKKDNKKNEYLC